MLERVLRFSIQHRWLVVLFTLMAAALGGWSLMRLPIDAVPDITNNQVQINTLYPALSPFEIEKQVTFPIETALAGIPGLEYTRSLSRNGFSQVTAVFADDVDIYFARQQVGERLREARENLPPGAEPRMGAISTGLGEIYMWTVHFEHPNGDGATLEDGKPGWQSDGTYLTPEGELLTNAVEQAAYLRTVQDWIIRPQLKNVVGVAGVDSIGGYEKQYVVQPDPMKLVSYGLTFHDVIEALEKNNVSTGAGFIEHKGEGYNVRVTGRIGNEDQIRDIVLGSRNGVPIHVRDVAVVGVGPDLRTGSASENGQEVVVGTALMLIGENSRTVSKRVDEKLAEINKSLPPDIRAKTVLNRTALVNDTIKTVEKNLAEGAILVIVILFLLLGNIRAAIITSLAIPLSMLLTATAMVHSRISGNLMSLGAIDFGLIVDGSVIIVENCLRMLAQRQHHLRRKLTLAERLETIFDASRQMIQPSVFGQAIIITVYIPILALTGIEGKMFKPMAATVIFALLSAFVLSLTLVPALVALGITGRVKEKENLLVRSAKVGYERIVRWAVRLRWAVVGVAILVFAGSALLFMRLGQEFVPQLDEGNIAVHAMRIPGTGIEQSTRMQLFVEQTLSKFPEVAFVYSKTGTAEMASDPMPPNVSDTFIILKPQDQWRSEDELDRLIAQKQEELQTMGVEAGRNDDHGERETAHRDQREHGEAPHTHKGKLLKLMELTLGQVPGNNYEFTQPIQMRFNELIAGVRSDVAVKLYGDEFEQMLPTAKAIAAILRDTAGAADVKVEQTAGLPMMTIELDRSALARYGLNVADVQDVINIAIGGREAGLVFQGDRRFDLVVRLPDHIRADIAELRNLPIPLPSLGQEGDASVASAADGPIMQPGRPPFVPLGSLAQIQVAEGPNQISREQGKRRVVVQANVRGRDIGSFVAEAQQRIADQVKLPAGTWLDWGGQFENLMAARQRLMIVVPICFLMIFLLLFSTFNSVKHAVMVFTCVPLALTGGVAALWIRDMPFSISAAVGFIALSGVAVLNGLVMVTFINQLRAEGEQLEHAIIRGSMTRLRPVLMTALVAALGFVPMALASGRGAEVQKPLATVVIGGIISSTLLTLVVLPAIYRIWQFGEGRQTNQAFAREQLA
ncbi:efflux RND transporter permease subunit [Fontivita pretiosa]|uniref:efflux RND transporter permease subunit n=1 Tax=Fontivita pretiosa TaxID=2989684 RepID=UPI003D17A2BC